MPDDNQIPVSRVFRIDVDKQGSFSFDPDKDWEYGRGDHICIECNVPFTIKFNKIGGKGAGLKSIDTVQSEKPKRLFTALRQVNGQAHTPVVGEAETYVAHIDVPDRDPQPEERRPIRNYRYTITATTKDISPYNDKNGSDIC